MVYFPSGEEFKKMRKHLNFSSARVVDSSIIRDRYFSLRLTMYDIEL